MMRTIIFNDCCVCWSKNYMFNKSFIEQRIRYIYDLICVQGYIYLDKIYGLFGTRWDPHEPNDVLIFGENEPRFVCSALGGGNYKISIYY